MDSVASKGLGIPKTRVFQKLIYFNSLRFPKGSVRAPAGTFFTKGTASGILLRLYHVER